VGPGARTYAHSRPAPAASEPRPGSNTLDIQMQHSNCWHYERDAMDGLYKSEMAITGAG
jgi:hypothetical protein